MPKSEDLKKIEKFGKIENIEWISNHDKTISELFTKFVFKLHTFINIYANRSPNIQIGLGLSLKIAVKIYRIQYRIQKWLTLPNVCIVECFRNIGCWDFATVWKSNFYRFYNKIVFSYAVQNNHEFTNKASTRCVINARKRFHLSYTW